MSSALARLAFAILWMALITLSLAAEPQQNAAETIGPLPPVPANPDNLPSEARMTLGRALFFDNRISATGTMNCASCHLPHQGWTVHTPISPANPGRVERRNSPTLLNVGYNKALIWDGRAWPLEKQAIGSTKNPIHKGQDIDRLMAIFNDDPDMVKLFEAAYGSKPNAADYGKALAVFQRHFIVTGDSDFDRYMKGDKQVMSAAAIRGMDLFTGKAGCVACHSGPNFTDSDFHNIGLGANPMLADDVHQEILRFDAKRMGVPNWESINIDPGRFLVTKDAADLNKFKTPTLRNLQDTFPYMHDGRHRTLDEVIDYYNRGGDGAPGQDSRVRELNLGDSEQADLKAFLMALRGTLPDIRMQDWVRPVDVESGKALDGKTLFEGKGTCVNCHQPDGNGVPGVFPPLAGNPRVTAGDGSYVANTIIHGRQGRVEINGKVFDAVMPPIGEQQGLNDEEIAAIASYVRNSWGNEADAVSPATVREQRQPQAQP